MNTKSWSNGPALLFLQTLPFLPFLPHLQDSFRPQTLTVIRCWEWSGCIKIKIKMKKESEKKRQLFDFLHRFWIDVSKIDGCMVEWMDGWMGGWVDGWKDAWISTSSTGIVATASSWPNCCASLSPSPPTCPGTNPSINTGKPSTKSPTFSPTYDKK